MYADYDFYLNVYLGDALTAEDFPKYSERASDYIRSATRGRSDHVTGAALEAVSKCSCAIAEILLDEEIMTASVFSVEQPVSSETVGSWSKTYRAPSVSAVEISYLADRKREALLLYLGYLPEFKTIFQVRSYPCVHRRG